MASRRNSQRSASIAISCLWTSAAPAARIHSTASFYNPADPQSYLGYFFPLEDVRKCRAELEPKADLKLYTTTIAMDDMDEVRAALGYEQDQSLRRLLRNTRRAHLPQAISAARANRDASRCRSDKPIHARRIFQLQMNERFKACSRNVRQTKPAIRRFRI